MKSASIFRLIVTTWLLLMTSPEVVARLTLLMNETETSRLLGLCDGLCRIISRPNILLTTLICSGALHHYQVLAGQMTW